MYQVPLLQEPEEDTSKPQFVLEYEVPDDKEDSFNPSLSSILDAIIPDENNILTSPILQENVINNDLRTGGSDSSIGDGESNGITKSDTIVENEGDDELDNGSAKERKRKKTHYIPKFDRNNNDGESRAGGEDNSNSVSENHTTSPPKTRRVSLTGPNKRIFTVTNHGNTTYPIPEYEPYVPENDIPHILVTSDSPFASNRILEEDNKKATLGLPDFQGKRASTSNLHSPTLGDNKQRENNNDPGRLCCSDDEDNSRNSFRLLLKRSVSKSQLSQLRSSQNSLINGSKLISPDHTDSVMKRNNLSVYGLANMISSPIREVIKRGTVFAKRKQDRLILKNGAINLATIRVEQKGMRFFQDLFTTLVDVKWRYMILLLASAFLGTWLAFALIWWAICAYQIKHGGPECVTLVDDFNSALLFSVETQHTIGYGSRAVTKDCPLAIFFVMFQSLIGVTMSCVTTGLVFAKFARPRRKAETLMFTKNAVVYEKEGERYLSFRVGDIRQNHMIQVTIQAIMFSHAIDLAEESEETPFQQHNLHVESEAENCFFLAWPIEIMHRIDRASPLWEVTEEDLLDSDFEIVVVFEGLITSTGQTTQICTSYLPSEILWGERLQPLITGRRESGKYLINYKDFNSTSTVRMSCHSARYESHVKKGVNTQYQNNLPDVKIEIGCEK